MTQLKPLCLSATWKGLRAGNADSFDHLFRDLYPSLCFFADQLLNDRKTAEEVASDSFLKLWQHRQKIRHPQSIKPFLYTTTRHACIDRLRQRKKKPYALTDPSLDTDTGHPLDALVRTELLYRLRAQLPQLPGQCSKVFSLHYVEGQSTREVAQSLQLSISTVKEYKSRGIAILRKKLGPLLQIVISVSVFFIVDVVH